MLDLIQGVFHTYWPRFTWTIFLWLSSARLVTLTLLGFTAVMAFASGRRHRRRMVTIGLALLATYWIVVSPLFSVPSTALLARFVPPDTGGTADAIVVLGRERSAEGDRYTTTVDLAANSRAPEILVMGDNNARKVFRGLEKRNLPTDGLLSATCITTTQEEADSAWAILGPQGVKKIILITDTPHMLRAWLTFKSIGFEVIPHIEPISPWVAHHERSFLALREYLGLASYALLGRFKQQPASNLTQVSQQISAEFPLNQCFLTADQIKQSFSKG
ncbi:MAG: YdcF family protein [Cyanobacteria bacterium J06638_6]